MGFSVSGSLVVVLLGLFIALSVYYGSVSNAMERVNDARLAQHEHSNGIHDADLNITSLSVVTSPSCGVELEVNNTGSTELMLNDTDLLLDNEYRPDWQTDTVVDGETTGDEPDTDLWLPGERVSIDETGLDAAPRSVKVVSGPGVADTREVTAAC